MKKHSRARVPATFADDRAAGHVGREPAASLPGGVGADGRAPAAVQPPDNRRAHEEAAGNLVRVDRVVEIVTSVHKITEKYDHHYFYQTTQDGREGRTNKLELHKTRARDG